MASEAALDRRGRPRIDDYLEVYMYVEVERQRRDLSIRALCARRDIRFKRVPTASTGEGAFAVIRGETLRRRYGDACETVGMTDPHPEVVSTAFEEYQAECRVLLDGMIAAYLS